jgi:DNA-binding transcriptional ArsR family regulator
LAYTRYYIKATLLKGKKTRIMYSDLDPILHQQLRLAVISLLVGVKEAEFNFIKEKTGSTAGNLSVQLNKLKEAGYVQITKQFKNNYPQTLCSISQQGILAFEKYVQSLKGYINL